jgi:hypothetical protein
MPIGMLGIGRFAGQAHEDGDHQIIGHIRSGVDAIGQQGRTVSKNSCAGLQDREEKIRHETAVDGKHAYLFSLLDAFHNSPRENPGATLTGSKSGMDRSATLL